MTTLSNLASNIFRDPLKHAVAPLILLNTWHKMKDNRPENRLLNRLVNSTNYDEWQTRAADLDRFLSEISTKTVGSH
ncbi:hypothetical protein DFQ29_004150 [Apophysomyces sp. BC1021]|nr:hypothetical protein DFQ29_004150 [Apophysomyces sp. BC1021]